MSNTNDVQKAKDEIEKAFNEIKTPAPVMMGWMCPRCGVVHGPFVQRCDCHPAYKTSTGTSIEINT